MKLVELAEHRRWWGLWFKLRLPWPLGHGISFWFWVNRWYRNYVVYIIPHKAIYIYIYLVYIYIHTSGMFCKFLKLADYMLPIPPFTEAEKSLIIGAPGGFCCGAASLWWCPGRRKFSDPPGWKTWKMRGQENKGYRGHLRVCSKEKISTPKKDRSYRSFKMVGIFCRYEWIWSLNYWETIILDCRGWCLL